MVRFSAPGSRNTDAGPCSSKWSVFFVNAILPLLYNHHGSAIERVYFAVLPVCENVVGVEMGKYKKSFQFAIVACQTALAA